MPWSTALYEGLAFFAFKRELYLRPRFLGCGLLLFDFPGPGQRFGLLLAQVFRKQNALAFFFPDSLKVRQLKLGAFHLKAVALGLQLSLLFNPHPFILKEGLKQLLLP